MRALDFIAEEEMRDRLICLSLFFCLRSVNEDFEDIIVCSRLVPKGHKALRYNLKVDKRETSFRLKIREVRNSSL